jgi:hypothetical protein
MQRNEIIDTLVLNEVSDDYEDLDHIVSGIATLPFAFPLKIEVHEVEAALQRLIASGYVQAYDLFVLPPLNAQIPGPLKPEEIDRYYFLQTAKGKTLHASLAWPPDDQGT